MLNCIALYRGERLSDLELVAICSDERIVSEFVARLLASEDKSKDRALAARKAGVHEALRTIKEELRHE